MQNLRFANELEGFIVNNHNRRVAPTLNGQRIDKAIYAAFNGDMRKCVSSEEYPYHFEIKNPKALDTDKAAIHEIGQIVTNLRGFLNDNDLDIVFQPLPPEKPSEHELSEDYLTDNAKRLMIEQGWSLQDMESTIIAGWQMNIDLPTEIIEHQLEQEFIRNLYNITSDNYEILMSLNKTSERRTIIEDLLVRNSQMTSQDPKMIYAPGGFNSISEMLEFLRICTKKDSIHDDINYKGAHAMTVKPKGPKSSIANARPTFFETRFSDSLDPMTSEGIAGIKTSITLIKGIISMITEQTLSPASAQSHPSFPMVPHPLDPQHPYRSAE